MEAASLSRVVWTLSSMTATTCSSWHMTGLMRAVPTSQCLWRMSMTMHLPSHKASTRYQCPYVPTFGPGLFTLEESSEARSVWGGLDVRTDLCMELWGWEGPISNQPSNSWELCPGSSSCAWK